MSGLKIIDTETRAELAELGMEIVEPRRRPSICRECAWVNVQDAAYLSRDLCWAQGNRRSGDLNPNGLCDRFDLAFADAPARGGVAPLVMSAIALATSIAALLLGGCSFPSEGIPRETVGDPDHYRPPHFAGGRITGSDAGSDSSSGGGSDSVGTDDAGGSTAADDASGATIGTESSEGSMGDVEGSSGPTEGSSTDSGSESTGGGPVAWEACVDYACGPDLACTLAVSAASCGTTSSCHICAPYCDSDDDCGGGAAFCFEQLGFCMLGCDVGCPDGAVCIDDAEDFCSFPDPA